MHKWLCLGMLLWAWPVRAQTHPCDVVPPTNPAVSSPVKLGFCLPANEAANVTAYKVYIDNVVLFNGPLTPIGTPNSGGMVYLEAPGVMVGQGSHSAQVSAVNLTGEGAKSAAYPFAAIGLPVAPNNLRIVP